MSWLQIPKILVSAINPEGIRRNWQAIVNRLQRVEAAVNQVPVTNDDGVVVTNDDGTIVTTSIFVEQEP